jgi:phosphoribosylformimino-5-aminoimidazole carboxamide ribotide isomerase
MDVIPAIDVQGGRCVRLRLGEHSTATIYGDEPAVIARNFIAAGATHLHVVDLDAARGVPVLASADAVAAVVAACVERACAVQVGGGVRDIAAAMHWLDSGAAFVVLGSVAARDPAGAVEICEAAGGRVLLGLDVRAGVARVQGWTEDGLASTELLRQWRTWNAAGLVYTDTTRDGVLTGPNLDGLRQCIDLYGGPVTVSGGISSVADIEACAAAGAAGVIVGKALYEGHVDLTAALRATRRVR